MFKAILWCVTGSDLKVKKGRKHIHRDFTNNLRPEMESRTSMKEEKQSQKTNGTAREHSWDKQKPDHEILKLLFLM